MATVLAGSQVSPSGQQGPQGPPVTIAGGLFRPSGVLYCYAQNMSSTGGSIEVITFDYILPANILSKDGDSIRLTTYYNQTAAVATKTFRIKWNGANVFVNTNAQANTGNYYMQTHIIRMDQTTQRIVTARLGEGSTILDHYTLGAADLSTPISLQTAIQAPPNDVVQRIVLLEFLPTP